MSADNGFNYFARTKLPKGKVTLGTGLTGTVNFGTTQSITIPLTNRSITITDNTTSGAHGSLKLLDFPEGLVVVQGAITNLTIARVGTNLTTTAAVVGSLGTVTVANTDATLTSTEADVIASTTATLTAGAGTLKGKTTAVAVLDGTAGAKSVFLNFAVPDAGSTGNDALLVNGSVTIHWTHIGDH